jgi:lipid-A-disaccharide synthase-like uncharacterized protein
LFFWIYDQPTWAMALAFSAAFAVFGIAGLTVFRRTTYQWMHRSERTNEVVGFAMSSFALLYGLLLGLLAVAAYGSYTATGDEVTKEAASLSALYRDVSGLPEPKRSELQASLRAYTREVIDVSWPLQREGIVPTGAGKIMKGFVAQLQAFRPADLGEKALFSESLSQMNTLLALRSSRLASVDSGIPDILWAVVLIGALINIILIWMINTERHVHIIITGMLSAFMGLVIFLIAAMDYPFRGEVSIDAGPFEQVYTMVMAVDPPAN